jgi:hypothetical protein
MTAVVRAEHESSLMHALMRNVVNKQALMIFGMHIAS